MRTSAICKISIGIALVLFLVILAAVDDNTKDFAEFQVALGAWMTTIGTLLLAAGALGFILAEFGAGPQPPVKSPYLAMLLVGITMLSHIAGLALVGLMAVRVWHDRAGGKASAPGDETRQSARLSKS